MSQNITIPDGNLTALRPALARAVSDFAVTPAPPSTAFSVNEGVADVTEGVLELADGSAYCGISFGAEKKSIAGECVFQTGSMPKIDLLIGTDCAIRDGWIYGVTHRSILRGPDSCANISSGWELWRP